MLSFVAFSKLSRQVLLGRLVTMAELQTVSQLQRQLERLQKQKARLEEPYLKQHATLTRRFYAWKRSQQAKIKALNDQWENPTQEQVHELKTLMSELDERQRTFDQEHGHIWSRYEKDGHLGTVLDEIKDIQGKLRLCHRGVKREIAPELQESEPGGEGPTLDDIREGGEWWRLGWWLKAEFLSHSRFTTEEILIALTSVKKVYNGKWFKREISKEPSERHYVASLLIGLGVNPVDTLTELGTSLALVEGCNGAIGQLRKRLKNPTQYLTAAFELEIISSLKRDFAEVEAAPVVPSGRQADIAVTMDSERVYFELTMLHTPAELKEMLRLRSRVKQAVQAVLAQKPLNIRVRLSPQFTEDQIGGLLGALGKIDVLPWDMQVGETKVSISRKTPQEMKREGPVVQVEVSFSEGKRFGEKLNEKRRQLHPHHPNVYVIRPFFPAVNLTEAKSQITREFELTPPRLRSQIMGALIITEILSSDGLQRVTFYVRNAPQYMRTGYVEVEKALFSRWKRKLATLAYYPSFPFDDSGPLVVILAKGHNVPLVEI
ncbi:hypothetical protein ES707_04500 [subsurface metagenome]